MTTLDHSKAFRPYPNQYRIGHLDNHIIVRIDYSRDELLTPFGLATVKDRYLMPFESSPQHMFARVACWFAKDPAHAQRLYDYMSQHWFMPATPILSNGGTDRGNPISCFVAGTPVMTKAGYKNIEEIQVGDMVVTHRGRTRPVLATRKQTAGELYEVAVHGRSTPLAVTGNHLLLTIQGWRRVDELDLLRDLVATTRVLDLDEADHVIHFTAPTSANGGNYGRTPLNSLSVDDEVAWALGFWFAEGSVTDNGTLKVTHGSAEWPQRWVDILSSRLGIPGCVRANQTWFDGEINSKTLVEYFNREFGRGCKEKTLTDWIVSLPQSKIAAFYEGAYAGDGFKTTNDRQIEMTNPRLIAGLSNILNRLGVDHSLQLKKKVFGGSITGKIYHSRGDKMQARYARYPFHDGLTYARIKSLKKVDGEQEVFDIEVAEDHSFSVAGVIAHNCFLNSVGDSLDDISRVWNENVWLAAKGGGIGTNWSNVREIGSGINELGKTSGIIPFIKVMDSQTTAISQGSLRRGSAAVYLDIDHPEIEEFIDVRRPIGDANRRSLNIHHGVNITDKFMEAVMAGGTFDLISRKTGEVTKTVQARVLWEKMLLTRLETGEPYMVFIDTVNRKLPDVYKALGLKVTQSNLCVAPETLVLTDQGHIPIADLAGKSVNVWNGFEFSNVTVRQTGHHKGLITVRLSDGASIDCTPEHKFYVQREYWDDPIEVPAKDLVKGWKLMKGELPVIEGHDDWGQPYYNGFFSGDGCHAAGNRDLIYFYGEKRDLVDDLDIMREFDGAGNVLRNSGGERHVVSVYKGKLWGKFTVPHNATIKTRLEWLAGLADSDGCLVSNNGTQSIQIANTNLPFLNEVRLMLQTLGVQSKVRIMHGDRWVRMPDGHGGDREYECKAVSRVMFGEAGIQQLLKLGFNPRRIKPVVRTPNRNAAQFVTVEAVEDNGRYDDTYCFTEPKRHLGVFNGVLTGQCSEIALHTGPDYRGKERTAVCCLSSLNMEHADAWMGNRQFIKDCLYFLDGVMDDFIRRTEGQRGFENARYSAFMERSVGLGYMGFHSYLQSKGIPYETPMAEGQNRRITGWVKATGDEINWRDAVTELGQNPDSLAAREKDPDVFPVRWSNWSSIAPTASISIIAGTTSPGVDAIPANVYAQKTLSGTFKVKNRHLEALLEQYVVSIKGDEGAYAWLEGVWTSITDHMGSVQHLDFLTEAERELFKTAFELDQRWVIAHAAARAPNVCQMSSNNISLPADVEKKTLLAIHVQAWKTGVPSLYYCRSFSLQRAENVGHLAGEMPQAVATHEVTLQDRGEKIEIDECLSCQ